MLGRGVSHASQPAASASIPPIIGPVAGARRWPVGAVLVLLVSALVLPGLVFSATLLGRLAASERAGLAAEAQAVTLRTAEALDRELTGQQATLRALASSPALAEGDLQTFYNQARDVVDAAECNVMLSDLSGQMLLNTCLPFGAPLPRVGQPDLYARAAKERSLVVSNLFTGVVHGEPTLAVALPVLRGPDVAYVLSMNLTPARLSRILVSQGLPSDWALSAVDGRDAVIAGSSCRIDPAAALRGLANTLPPAAACASFSARKSALVMNTSPRTSMRAGAGPCSAPGRAASVRRLAVTSSPSAPSPRVAPRTKRPSS